MKKIIAVVGMCGAGKSVVANYLEEYLGYKRVYFGGVTMKKLAEANLEVNPDNERKIREKLRQELGMSAYAKVLLPEIKELAKTDNVVLDGLYSWAEYKYLIAELPNMKVIAVVTDKKLRYKRLIQRPARPLSNSEAEYRDISELEKLEKAQPIAFADYFICNNKGVVEVVDQLTDILGYMSKKEEMRR